MRARIAATLRLGAKRCWPAPRCSPSGLGLRAAMPPHCRQRKHSRFVVELGVTPLQSSDTAVVSIWPLVCSTPRVYAQETVEQRLDAMLAAMRRRADAARSAGGDTLGSSSDASSRPEAASNSEPAAASDAKAEESRSDAPVTDSLPEAASNSEPAAVSDAKADDSRSDAPVTDSLPEAASNTEQAAATDANEQDSRSDAPVTDSQPEAGSDSARAAGSDANKQDSRSDAPIIDSLPEAGGDSARAAGSDANAEASRGDAAVTNNLPEAASNSEQAGASDANERDARGDAPVSDSLLEAAGDSARAAASDANEQDSRGDAQVTDRDSAAPFFQPPLSASSKAGKSRGFDGTWLLAGLATGVAATVLVRRKVRSKLLGGRTRSDDIRICKCIMWVAFNSMIRSLLLVAGTLLTDVTYEMTGRITAGEPGLTKSCSLQGGELLQLQEELDAAQTRGLEQMQQEAELKSEIASLAAGKAVLHHQVGVQPAPAYAGVLRNDANLNDVRITASTYLLHLHSHCWFRCHDMVCWPHQVLDRDKRLSSLEKEAEEAATAGTAVQQRLEREVQRTTLPECCQATDIQGAVGVRHLPAVVCYREPLTYTDVQCK